MKSFFTPPHPFLPAKFLEDDIENLWEITLMYNGKTIFRRKLPENFLVFRKGKLLSCG
jgi:hypothetical protein